MNSEDRFGRLIIKNSFMNKGRRYWNCICDCGNNITTLQQSLKSGRVNSCGCLKKERASKMCVSRKLPDNKSASNELIYKYKLRAKKENIDWDLTDDQCMEIFKRNCTYCGSKPSRERKRNTSVFIYNGIDRVNNNKGYIFDNVVSCCMRCNYMKSNLTVDEFLGHIKKIWENLNE